MLIFLISFSSFTALFFLYMHTFMLDELDLNTKYSTFLFSHIKHTDIQGVKIIICVFTIFDKFHLYVNVNITLTFFSLFLFSIHAICSKEREKIHFIFIYVSYMYIYKLLHILEEEKKKRIYEIKMFMQ